MMSSAGRPSRRARRGASQRPTTKATAPGELKTSGTLMTGGRIARAAGVTANQWWCWWRDSNPHWADFKSAASADWATPARPGRSEPLDLLVGLLDPPLLPLLVLELLGAAAPLPLPPPRPAPGPR